MAGAGVEPALNRYPAEREGLALPGYQKSKSYESRITAIKVRRGGVEPRSCRILNVSYCPDLPLAGRHYSPHVPVFPGCHVLKKKNTMNKSAHHCGFVVKKGLEPFTAHSIFGLPVQATPPVSLPFQAGLHSRACLSLCVFCVM